MTVDSHEAARRARGETWHLYEDCDLADASACDVSLMDVPKSIVDGLVILKLRAFEAHTRGDHAEDKRLLAQLDREKNDALNAARTARGRKTDEGATMCKCNQPKIDAVARERLAREKMIADNANAWRTPVATDAPDAVPTPVPATDAISRERAARDRMLAANASAHKRGKV
jgi:hypothetical protein